MARPMTATIEVAGLSHSYAHDDSYQVKDVSFEVAEGEIFGFLGPNGAGKSTTQKILLGLLDLQHGDVRVAGIDMRSPTRDLFDRIGVLFEQPNVYRKLTGNENLKFFKSLYGVPTDDLDALLKHFGIYEARDRRVSGYSKGMAQRLCLARSLINKPKIWFLDEPASGLDPVATAEMVALIQQKREAGTTIFITTHNMQIADTLCDRVAFLNRGQIVAIDSPRNLKLRLGEQQVKVEHRDDADLLVETCIGLKDSDGPDRLADLLGTGRVETVHSQEATLEQVYISLTGERLT